MMISVATGVRSTLYDYKQEKAYRFFFFEKVRDEPQRIK
jgi:hypothetical protein